MTKREIVEGRIKHLLNKNNEKRIFARNCEIREISVQEKNAFLDENHIQGRDTSQVKLGAFYNDELVAVMTFAKGRIAKGSKPEEYVWELNRFCTKLGYSVIGIAGRLLKYFQTHYQWKKIFSYADRRWSNGEMYKRLNFSLERITKPNYWYIMKGRRIHRFALRKSLAQQRENANLTEFEIRSQEGYDRIWDCGHYKFSVINLEDMG